MPHSVQDEFVGQRLPDIPNDGYSTAREKALSDEVMFFIRGTERNRRLLLSILRDGRERFRKIGKKAWSHLKVDTEMCDAVFDSLVCTAFPAYALAHGDRRAWDYGELHRMAVVHLSALEDYERQTMAQKIQNQQAEFERAIHAAMQKHSRRH